MTQDEVQLKPVPNHLTKQKIYELYNHLSKRRVIQTIHWIQVEHEKNPNISDKEAKRRWTLTEPEVRELFRSLGSPKGYEQVL